MPVDEFVQLPEKHPSDLRVVANGYEGGYDDLSPGQVSLAKIGLNTGKDPWEGARWAPSGLIRSARDGA